MLFKKPDLTSGLRPVLQQDETLLFLQNNVGLYQGKSKIADCQNGSAYLTSHRICYVDDKDPRTSSLAVDLKDVDKFDLQAGYLKKSPKITIYPKIVQRPPGQTRSPISPNHTLQRLQQSSSISSSRSTSPYPLSPPVAAQAKHAGSWVCPICSCANPVPSNFDPATASASTSVPPCLMCGVSPPLATVLKAAISAGSAHLSTNTDPRSSWPNHEYGSERSAASEVVCPKCTYHNHPSLHNCELCEAPLPFKSALESWVNPQANIPFTLSTEVQAVDQIDVFTEIKISFRAGGEKVFHEKMKSAIVQRKWLTTIAPPAPNALNNIGRSSTPNTPVRSSFESGTPPQRSGVGIGGLQQLGTKDQVNGELVIGAAFEDIEALMSLKKEVLAFTQAIGRATSGMSDTMLDNDFLDSEPAMVATRDMLNGSSDQLYISELSRDLAEYVTDERRGILRKQGGTMSLVDLWATFNRSRDGVEMVSPADFHKACAMWTDLRLPVRLREFKSKLLAVQRSDHTDERTIEQLQKWLDLTRIIPPDEETAWDWQRYGCGVTAHDAARKFGWSLGIAAEELEMAEDRGILCREDSGQGLKFWLNLMSVVEPGEATDL